MKTILTVNVLRLDKYFSLDRQHMHSQLEARPEQVLPFLHECTSGLDLMKQF